MISNYINFYELERNICPDCVGNLGGGGGGGGHRNQRRWETAP